MKALLLKLHQEQVIWWARQVGTGLIFVLIVVGLLLPV